MFQRDGFARLRDVFPGKGRAGLLQPHIRCCPARARGRDAVADGKDGFLGCVGRDLRFREPAGLEPILDAMVSRC
jgi:hypothetical protein